MFAHHSDCQPGGKYYLDEVTKAEVAQWLKANKPPAFSRPTGKGRMSFEFSDGSLCAELLDYILPKGAVDLKFYHAGSAIKQKITNWTTLSSKVLLPKLGFELKSDLIQGLAEFKEGYFSYVLYKIREAVEAFRSGEKEYPAGPNNKEMESSSAASESDFVQLQDNPSTSTELNGLKRFESLSISPTSTLSSGEPESSEYQEALKYNQVLLQKTNYWTELLKLRVSHANELAELIESMKEEIKLLHNEEIKHFGY